MTQEDLAEKLSLSRQAISNYERGKTKPDLTILMSLAEIFNVPVEELLDAEADAVEQSGRRKKAIIHLVLAGLLGGLCLAVHYFSVWLYGTGKDSLFLFSVGFIRPLLLFVVGVEVESVIRLVIKRRAKRKKRRLWRIVFLCLIAGFMFLSLFVGLTVGMQILIPGAAGFAVRLIQFAPWLNAFTYINYYGWPAYLFLGFAFGWLRMKCKKRNGD